MRKSLILLCTLFAFSLFALPRAHALDLTGEWTGDLDTPNGPFTLNYTLKQDGAKLTGSVMGPDGIPLPISDGKLDGDKISFNVLYNGSVITNTGTATADAIKISTGGGDLPPTTLTLKRKPASAPAAGTPTTTPPPPTPPSF